MEIFRIILKLLLLFGSLGVFLYGMRLMSEALQKVAGQKMRDVLDKVTSNSIKSVFTGLMVTGIIQSSSATTVMVVSFINAGLITITGAIGLIMGANIGTTVTAWLSIVGFTKIGSKIIALSLIGLSFPLLFSQKSRRKSIGEFVFGFSLLLLGLELLKEFVPNIKDNPELIAFIANYTYHGFRSIMIFIVIGIIITMVLQSSSATMALTFVMCYKGWIGFDHAAAMVLGENIGTTITVNIAAIIANRSAKIAA